MQPSALEYSKGLFRVRASEPRVAILAAWPRALGEWRFLFAPPRAIRMSRGASGQGGKARETGAAGDGEKQSDGDGGAWSRCGRRDKWRARFLRGLAAPHNDGDGGVSRFPFVGFMVSRGSTASPLSSLCHCGGDTGARSPSARVEPSPPKK